MERLPFIDEHRLLVDAPPEVVWAGLLSLLRGRLGAALTAPLKPVLGLRPSVMRGDWHGTPRPGDTIPGFAVAESRFASRLALRGEHRFSRYALVFELEAAGGNRCMLRARSWAEFPGLAGRAYGAMVVGTGGHRLAVARMLRMVASRSRPAAAP